VSEDSSKLVEQLRAGDADAERYFHETFGRLVRGMALSEFPDAEAARDIAQEVLLVSIVAIRNGTILHENNLGGFVYGTARNVISNWRRRRIRDTRRNGPAPSDDLPANPGPDPDGEDRVEEALAEIRRLPPVDRQILQWALVEGRTSREISARLGISAAAVRKRKSRAIEALTTRLRNSTHSAKRRH